MATLKTPTCSEPQDGNTKGSALSDRPPDTIEQGAQITNIERGLVAVEAGIRESTLRALFCCPRKDHLKLLPR